MLQPILILLTVTSNFLISLAFAKPTCVQDNVYKALTSASLEGSLFCSDYLVQTSYSGTLREPFTIFVIQTVTNAKSTDPVTVFKSSGTSTIVKSTSYSSQASRTPNPTAFTRPLPSYIEQYPPTRVSSACSCIAPSIRTDTVYRVCERSAGDSLVSSTITTTVGKPGKSTLTFSYTDTTTVYATTNAPFPTACPDADNVDYIASDLSTWERGCNTSLYGVRPLITTTAPDFDSCIEACVAYNKKERYNQCQAVLFFPQNGNQCQLGTDPTYFAHDAGDAQVATLRFYEPSRTTPNFCATVTGAVGGV